MSLSNKPGFTKEATDWLKILDNLQQENVRLKNQVAEVIKKDVTGSMLDQAELILNSIINKEAVIALLRRDIVHHLKDTQKTDSEQMQVKLREDIGKMQGELQKLTLDFTAYTDTSLSA